MLMNFSTEHSIVCLISKGPGYELAQQLIFVYLLRKVQFPMQMVRSVPAYIFAWLYIYLFRQSVISVCSDNFSHLFRAAFVNFIQRLYFLTQTCVLFWYY
jgi:hypothetical protein